MAKPHNVIKLAKPHAATATHAVGSKASLVQPLEDAASASPSALTPALDLTTATPPAVILAAVAAPRLIFIDPTAAYGGNGTMATPYNSWYSFQLQPGDIALQKGGTVSAGMTITAQGTAALPIIIGSYGNGPAQFHGTIVLQGASNVTLTGLDITGGNAYGVVFTNNTNNSTVQGSSIHGGISGVLLTGGTTNSNAISNNKIFDNDVSGVWFDGSNASAGAETLVIGNTIYRNGQQGISLHSSHVIVDSNTIVNNGLSGIAGASGIHVYGQSASDPSGQANVISNNLVADQRDGSSFDGNGIQLDHWTRGNSLVGNTVSGNDGSGINLFSSGNNLVLNNTVSGNVVDSGGTHVTAHAEIYVGEAAFAPGLSTGNVIAGNNVLATNPDGAAVQVDPAAAQRTNIIGGNNLAQAGSGPLWIWGSQSGTTLAGWNGFPHTGTDNGIGAAIAPLPAFAADMLDKTLTLHSTTFTSLNPTGISLLVANAGNENPVGGSTGNWMAGDGKNNVLTGSAGNDMMSAGSGNVTLIGNGGNDLLFGGAGNDVIMSGAGSSLMVGGRGNTQLLGGSGDDVIYAGNGYGHDTLSGGGGNNQLIGGSGVDTFVLGLGHDLISGFTLGQDFLDVSGLGIRSFTDLKITGDASGGVIDNGGGAYTILSNVNINLLSAKDFIFAK